MKLNLLTVQEYKDLRYKLIKELEGSRPNPYKDSKKILTIGIGFNGVEVTIDSHGLKVKSGKLSVE